MKTIDEVFELMNKIISDEQNKEGFIKLITELRNQKTLLEKNK